MNSSFLARQKTPAEVFDAPGDFQKRVQISSKHPEVVCDTTRGCFGEKQKNFN